MPDEIRKGGPGVGGRLVRTILIIVGSLSLILGIIGIFIPVLPTTPLLILAAACYARSSEKFYTWLVNNRYFGKFIRDYHQKKTMHIKAKIISLAFLWVTMGLTLIFGPRALLIKFILILTGIGVSIHILSIRSQADDAGEHYVSARDQTGNDKFKTGL